MLLYCLNCKKTGSKNPRLAEANKGTPMLLSNMQCVIAGNPDLPKSKKLVGH